MDLESKKAQLKEAILPILEEEALELIELNFIVHGRSSTLRLLVDRKEGGINLGDCARLNTRIGAVLDEANLLAERYILEVSSPGLDRPLVTPRDYARCINRKARFFLSEPIKGKVELQGEIKQASEESVLVEVECETIEIPLAKVGKAKQIIE